MAARTGLPTLLEMTDAAQGTLALGARAHAELASDSLAAVAECRERDRWTCGCCGIRVPGYMEVDHVNGHTPCDAGQLRAICQFCHNLKHPVWAALRGRFRLISAPGIGQASLHRIAWQVFFSSGDDSDGIEALEIEDAARSIVRGAFRREAILAEIIGSTHPEGFFEALFAARRLLGEEGYGESVRLLEGLVRFWPAAADLVETESVPASAALSCWSDGRFADHSAQAAREYVRNQRPPERLHEILIPELPPPVGACG